MAPFLLDIRDFLWNIVTGNEEWFTTTSLNAENFHGLTRNTSGKNKYYYKNYNITINKKQIRIDENQTLKTTIDEKRPQELKTIMDLGGEVFSMRYIPSPTIDPIIIFLGQRNIPYLLICISKIWSIRSQRHFITMEFINWQINSWKWPQVREKIYRWLLGAFSCGHLLIYLVNIKNL